jgi:hypothetical protein
MISNDSVSPPSLFDLFMLHGQREEETVKLTHHANCKSGWLDIALRCL